MLKDDSEIAVVVSAALLGYANRVQNGAVAPYRKLLSEDSVRVLVTITEGGTVSVLPFEEPKPIFLGIDLAKEEEKPFEDSLPSST